MADDGSEHRLLLGRTDSAVDAALVVHHANAVTILDDTEVGKAVFAPSVSAEAARAIAAHLNHALLEEKRLGGVDPDTSSQVDWLERRLIAPLRDAVDRE